MIFTPTRLAGAFIVELEKREDERGFFARTFSREVFAERGLWADPIEESVAYNHRGGTVRGMHFQFPPFAESKYVRCSRGSLLDVVIDLRPESTTYLAHVAVEPSDASGRGLYCPPRFAHGYQTLTDATEVSYVMAHPYAPDAQGGLPYDDPRLGIDWPLPVSIISERDRAHPPLAQVEVELRRRMGLEDPPA